MGTFETRADVVAAVQKYPALRDGLLFSDAMLSAFRSALNAEFGEPAADAPFVAVSGSIARREASPSSDIDYMVVFPGAFEGDRHAFLGRVRDVLHAATSHLSNQSLARPNPKGVFGAAVEGDTLVAQIGSREEDYDNISRRLLLLLESQTLWNDVYFDSLREKLVQVYALDVKDDSSKHFVLLINDLIRYFRTICVNYHNVMANERGKWPLRNVKLRHSRVLMYTSLLYCLGELSKYEHARYAGGYSESPRTSKAALLQQYVAMTPLQRLISLYSTNRDDNVFRLLSLYNNFLAAMSDPVKRDELMNLDYDKRYESPVFAALKANSDAFAAEILRFLYARRGSWSDRFFEYLIL
jgi:hypothetical protein